jgi:ferredoxin
VTTWAVEVDRDVCMGSGMCCIYASSSFDIDDQSKAVFKGAHEGSLAEVETAVEACPTGALVLRIDGGAAVPRGIGGA